MLKKILPLIIIVVAISCHDSNDNTISSCEEKTISLNDTFNLPLDTAAIIDLMDLKLRDQTTKITDIDNLDTLELMYMSYACDCQQWVRVDQYELWFSKRVEYLGLAQPHPFNTDEFGFFLEPGTPEIKLPECIGPFQAKVLFIGTIKEDSTFFTESKIPLKKQILTYYSYDVILPVKVYGPHYRTGKTEIPSDKEELIERSVIVIKKPL